MTTSLVMLSGGIGSATALGMAVAESGPDNVTAIHFYSSPHNRARGISASMLAQHYGIKPPVFVGSFAKLFAHEIQDTKTHVPLLPTSDYMLMQNGVRLSLAASYAAYSGYESLWLAALQDDNNMGQNVDLSPEYIGAQYAAIRLATHLQVTLVTPFLWMNQGQVTGAAIALDVPLEKTWDCVRTSRDNGPCGRCAGCHHREEGFTIAHAIDPLTRLMVPTATD